MRIIHVNEIADLPVRKTLRNRPSDSYAWWVALTHELPADCSVSSDVVLEISRRHHGADVDVVTENGATEIVAWLQPREDGPKYEHRKKERP